MSQKLLGNVLVTYEWFVCAICKDVPQAKEVVQDHFLSDGQLAQPAKFEFFEVVEESDSYVQGYPVKSLGCLLDPHHMELGSIIVKYDMEVCAKYSSLEEAKAGILQHHFVEDDPSEAQYFEFFEVVGKAKSGPRVERIINGWEVKELGFILK